MSSHDEEVNYRFNSETKGVTDGVKKIQDSLTELQHGMHAIEGALAFEKIKEGFTEFLTASDKAETSQARFANTMRATGQALDPKAFLEYAEALEKVSTFQTDDTVAAGAMLARFKLSQDQIESMLPAVQDLAASMGTNLAGAADQVGRAVTVGAQGLRSLNLGFNATDKAAFDAADTTGRLDIIMQRINGTIGGTAAIMAGTAVGAMKQYDNAMEGLYETFGKVLDKPIGDMIRKLTEDVRSAKLAFDNLDPSVKTFMGEFATGAVGLGATAAALTSIAGAFGLIGAAMPAIKTGFSAIAGAMAAFLPQAIAFSVVAVGIIGIIGEGKRLWDEFGTAAMDALAKIGAVISGALTTAINTVMDKWRAFSDAFKESAAVIMSLMKGGSIIEAFSAGKAAIAPKPDDNGPSALGTFITNLKDALKLVSGDAKDAATELLTGMAESFHMGADVLKEALKGMGLDLDKMLNGGAGGEGGAGVHGGGGGGLDADGKAAKDKSVATFDPNSISDLLNGKASAEGKQSASQGAAGNLSMSTGSQEAAEYFVQSMQKAFALSTEVVERIGVIANGSESGMLQLAGAMKGLTSSAQAQVLDVAGENESNIDKLAFAFQGFSDEGVAMLTKAGENVDDVANLSNELYDNWKTSLELANQAADKARADIAAGHGVSSSGSSSDPSKQLTPGDLVMQAGAKMASGMGPGGQIASGAMQGAQAGGPVGAAVGAGIAILMQTKTFGLIVNELTHIVGPLVQAFEPLMQALEPFMSIIQLVVNIFISLMKILSPVITLIQYLGDVVEMVCTGIAGIYNGLIEAVAEIFDVLSHVLPWGAGDAAGDVRDGLRRAEVSTNYGSDSRDQSAAVADSNNKNTAATQANTQALQQANNVPGGWVVSAAIYAAVLAGMKGPGQPGVTSTAPSAGGSWPTVSGSGSGIPTVAISGVLKGIFDKVNGTIGTKGGLDGNTFGAPTVKPHPRGDDLNPPNIITANITAVDPADAWAKIKKLAALDNFRTTGSTVASGANPFTLAKSTAGLR